jgi:hypothetical protein
MTARRDTPVDALAVVEAPSLPLAAQQAVGEALLALRRFETIQAAYDGWGAVLAAQSEVRRGFDDEALRLTAQGNLVIGALASLEAGPTGAAAQLEATVATLRQRQAQAESLFEQTLAEAIGTATDRVRRAAQQQPPTLRLMVRTLGAERRILQIERPSPDDAVLLCWACTGHIPTRYDSLFDDSTDDARLAPGDVYGPTPRLGPDELRDVLESTDGPWPIKGHVPLPGPAWYRLKARGVVLEAEIADGSGWRAVLAVNEAEAFIAALLKMRLEGRVGLELVRG